ncbi:MAG: rhodanese-like domain-containing protein [Dehalococcoidia bacterium]|nr:rhodanese-like domain-containing protein [Dehalococcoidia bacterium]
MRAALGLLITALVLSGACAKGGGPESPGQVIEDISLEEAFALMEDNRGSDNFTIIDLRSTEEYASGHIDEATNLDYSSSDFSEALDELDREGVYLIYSHDDDVSGQVLDAMVGLGFTEVYNMLGGMEHWEEIGLPQVK